MLAVTMPFIVVPNDAGHDLHLRAILTMWQYQIYTFQRRRHISAPQSLYPCPPSSYAAAVPAAGKRARIPPSQCRAGEIIGGLEVDQWRRVNIQYASEIGSAKHDNQFGPSITGHLLQRKSMSWGRSHRSVAMCRHRLLVRLKERECVCKGMLPVREP